MTTDTNSQPMPVTLEQMAQAFEAWEKGFRAEPSNYMTAEECAAANVSALSANRAAYFYELLAASETSAESVIRRDLAKANNSTEGMLSGDGSS